MPEMPFGAIIFCSFFAMAFSGAALWVLGKKAGALHRKNTHFPSAFLTASVAFSSAYILNRLVFPGWPKTAAVCNLGLLSGIFLFQALKKKFRHLSPKTVKRHRLHAEAEVLEHVSAQDPLNAYYFEKLSVIYEEMGKSDKALEAALKAVKLDPTVDNKWRVEELKESVLEKMRQKGKRRPSAFRRQLFPFLVL